MTGTVFGTIDLVVIAITRLTVLQQWDGRNCKR